MSNQFDVITMYQSLTGKTIPQAQLTQYQSFGKRAVAMLESKLGWPLTPVDNVEIIGVAKAGCSCDKMQYGEGDLYPAPELAGTARVFSVNPKSKYVFTDPFKNVHGAYIVRSVLGENGKQSFVVLKRVTKFVPKYNSTFGRYLEACQEMSPCMAMCSQQCTNCTSLLVDADWVTGDDLGDDIGFLICDFIDWLADDGIGKMSLKSEKVDGHEVTYGDSVIFNPYMMPASVKILSNYIGPYGDVGRNFIR